MIKKLKDVTWLSRVNTTPFQPELFNHTIHEGGYGYATQMSNNFAIPLALYFVALVFCCLVFNFILLSTILSKSSLRSVTNLFIVNLGVADLIVAVTVVLDAEFLIRGKYVHNVDTCAVKESIFMFSLPSTVINLTLLTVERFFMVAFPYKHGMLFTKSKVYIILFICWSYTLVVALFPVFYYSQPAVVEFGECYIKLPQFYTKYQFAVHFIVPVIIIITLNSALLIIASSHEAKIIRLSPASNKKNKKQSQNIIAFVASVKAAKTIMLLVGVFLCCWLSFIILVIHNINCNICHPRELTWIGSAVNYSSIAFNPLLYGLKNQNIRKQVIRKYQVVFQNRFFGTKKDCYYETIQLRESPSNIIRSKTQVFTALASAV